MQIFKVIYEHTSLCTATFPAGSEAEAREVVEKGLVPISSRGVMTTGRTTEINILKVE